MSDIVVIREPNNTVVVSIVDQTSVVQETDNLVTEQTTVNQVIVGAPGPQGPPGSFYYLHHQVAASSTWTVLHNLHAKPGVQLFYDGVEKEVFWAKIVHDSDDQFTVFLNAPITGYAEAS